ALWGELPEWITDVKAVADIPSCDRARELARLVRSNLSRSRRLDIRGVCKRLGIEVKRVDLGAARGGREGLLIPLRRNRFRIVVDPTPPGDWDVDHSAGSALGRQRWRFRVAHELAHTFFYESGHE